MVAFYLFPDSPFPKKEIRDAVLSDSDGCARVNAVELEFLDAEEVRSGAHAKIVVVTLSHEECDVYVSYQSSLSCNGGREQFQSDMSGLKDALVEAGGFCIQHLSMFLPCCQDDLVPDAITMFNNASVERAGGNILVLGENGEAIPKVATAIVESWRIGSTESGRCVLHRKTDLSQDSELLRAIFAKPRLVRVDLSSYLLLCNETLGLMTSLLSSPSSSLRGLYVSEVRAGAEADRQLASMLKSNKSLRSLKIVFDSDSWVATEMLRAMRERNCTLNLLFRLSPVCRKGSLAHTCQEEIDLYKTLNKLGRKCMRSTTFQPRKIPKLLESAGRAERRQGGRYLYPLLRENPSLWTGHLGERVQAPTEDTPK